MSKSLMPFFSITIFDGQIVTKFKHDAFDKVIIVDLLL